MTGRRFPLWIVLGVVVVLALLVGSGAFHSSSPTPGERAASIESVVRCPSCEDLSVAQSTAPTALAVRAAVTQLIAEGRTDQQIENYLVARYGSTIVLDPPASGWSLLVWLLPLAGGVVALVALVALFVRRRRVADGGGFGGPAVADGSSPGASGPDRRALADQQRFLERSLTDADAEYLAGDLSDADYLALRRRDMARLGAVEARMAEVDGGTGDRQGTTLIAVAPPTTAVTTEPPEATGTPARQSSRSRRSWWFLAGAVAAFAAALIVAVSLFATDRQPGQSVTGSVSTTPAQQIDETLAQAATDENQGQLGPAAQLYQSVLNAHPDNEAALVQLGWLEYETGQQGASPSLIADARTKLDRALRLAPGDYAVHLYLGTVLLQQDDNAAAAVAQYQQFLADRPPVLVVSQAAAELRNAYQQAGLAVPSGVPAA